MSKRAFTSKTASIDQAGLKVSLPASALFTRNWPVQPPATREARNEPERRAYGGEGATVKTTLTLALPLAGQGGRPARAGS